MPEIRNTRVTPRKRLSRIPQLMARKHAGNPKHQGDAILERLLATRHALGQGPSTTTTARLFQGVLTTAHVSRLWNFDFAAKAASCAEWGPFPGAQSGNPGEAPVRLAPGAQAAIGRLLASRGPKAILEFPMIRGPIWGLILRILSFWMHIQCL